MVFYLNFESTDIKLDEQNNYKTLQVADLMPQSVK